PCVATMLASTAVIWAAIYLLWMFQRVVFGRITKPENGQLKDLNAREIGLLVPLLILMVLMGIYPRPVLDRSRANVAEVRTRIKAGQRGGTITAEINK